MTAIATVKVVFLIAVCIASFTKWREKVASSRSDRETPGTSPKRRVDNSPDDGGRDG